MTMCIVCLNPFQLGQPFVEIQWSYSIIGETHWRNQVAHVSCLPRTENMDMEEAHKKLVEARKAFQKESP